MNRFFIINQTNSLREDNFYLNHETLQKFKYVAFSKDYRECSLKETSDWKYCLELNKVKSLVSHKEFIEFLSELFWYDNCVITVAGIQLLGQYINIQ